MDKKQIMEKLDTAYSFLSKIPVMDEAVDYMAMARQELRLLYAEVAKSELEKPLKEAETHEFRPVQTALKQQKGGDCHE